MLVVLTIGESQHGLWRVCRGSALIVDRLQFAQAIREARSLAREQNIRHGHTVRVDMTNAKLTITLAQYASNEHLSGVEAA
jgi:hypothetical protein